MDSDDEFEPTRWYRVVYPDAEGSWCGWVWCQTSVPSEARDALRRCPHEGAVVQRLYERTECEWRTVT